MVDVTSVKSMQGILSRYPEPVEPEKSKHALALVGTAPVNVGGVSSPTVL
jgi:hypothetical protein